MARTVRPRVTTVRSKDLLASDSIIFGMSPNPEPLYAAWNFVTQRSVMIANAHRPQFA